MSGDTMGAVLLRAADLLAELYSPAGVLIYWSSPNRWIGDKRPCDLVAGRDVESLELLCTRLNALCDGAFL